MDDTQTPGQPLTANAKPAGGRVGDWLMLLLVLAISAMPIFIVPGKADSMRTMENITVLSAQETWLRQHGWQDIEADSEAWLIPTRNGNPRIGKPPLVIWLDMLAWTGLTPETSTAQELITRARLVSGAMGLMGVAGVYWIGLVLRDRKLAVLAALAAGTSLFLTRQARIASYDIHMTGWATLAVASAIWAMKPPGKIASAPPGTARFLFGWTLAGIALAGAYMSKGPLSLLVGAGPVLTTLIVVRERWLRNVIGMMLMLCVTALLTAPWYLYVLYTVRDAEGMLLHEYQAERMEFQNPLYYLGLFGLIVPWSIWLGGALLQPFMRASGGQRRKLMVGWVWFALIIVAFSIPGAKQQRYIFPIMPAAALLIGQLWWYHQQLSEQGRIDPGVNLLRLPHWVVVLGISLLAWPFFTMQGWMLQEGWVRELPVGDVSNLIAGPVGILLIVLAVLGTVWHFKWSPMRAGVVTALWSSVLLTLVWYAQAVGPRTDHPVRTDCEQIGEMVQGGVVGMWLDTSDPIYPNEEFLLYARRIIPVIEPSELSGFGQGHKRRFVVAPPIESARAALRENGYRWVRSFNHDYDEQMDLWRYVGVPADQGKTKPTGDLTPAGSK